MTQPNEQPYYVDPSPLKDQAGTATRDILLVLGVIPALVAVIGTRDLKQIVDFIASAQFAPVLGLLVTTGIFVWRQFIARNAKAKLVTVARSAKDDVAVVLEPGAKV